MCGSLFLFVFVLIEPYPKPTEGLQRDDGVAELSALGALAASPVVSAIIAHKPQATVLDQAIPANTGDILLVKLFVLHCDSPLFVTI